MRLELRNSNTYPKRRTFSNEQLSPLSGKEISEEESQNLLITAIFSPFQERETRGGGTNSNASCLTTFKGMGDKKCIYIKQN